MTSKEMEGTPATSKPVRLLCSSRLAIFLLFFAGTTQFMLQRFNINFALVCMVKSPADHHVLNATNFTDSILGDPGKDELLHLSYGANLSSENLLEQDDDYECKKVQRHTVNGTFAREGEFDWSKDVQGAILASFFYGFLFTQIPGGWMSDRFGAKKALLLTTIVFSVITLLHPVVARLGPEYLFALRLLQGVSHGVTLPCMNVISVRWSGPTERAFLMGIGYGGFSVGAVITFPLCAMICEHLGWPFIFYITGGIGLLWCVGVHFFLFDWPENHPRVSEEELLFLQKNRTVQHTKQKLRVPWMKIFFSLPVNVMHICHFCLLWGFQTLSMYLPTFMKEVLYMDISSNGLYSSLPYVGMFFLHLGIGRFFDSMRAKNFCSITVLRKIFNTIGTLLPGVSLLCVYFLTCNNYLGGLIAISVGQAFIEFAMMGGYLFSVFDLAPRFAGILTGITNTFGVLPGLLCPVAVTLLTPDGTREQWLIVFYLAAAVIIFGCFIYLLFGSSELQPWAAAPPSMKETEMKALEQKLLQTNNGSSNGVETRPGNDHKGHV